MTVSSPINKVTWLGNGATTVFTYTFAMPSALCAVLLYTDSAGNQVTIAQGNYRLTGVGQPTPGGGLQGGTLTYPLTGGLAIAAGTTLTLMRVMPLTQPNAFENQSGLWPTVVEGSDDNLALQIQQVSEQLGRALLFNPADTGPFGTFPTAMQRRLQLLGFDGVGTPIAAQPASALVSTPMQPVVSAATLAQARAQLGVAPAVTPIGVVGDGLTDDTLALQAAIDTAIASALPLFIEPGRYLVSAPLTLKRGIKITGAGSEPFVNAFSPNPAVPGNGTWFVLDGTHMISVFVGEPGGASSALNQVFDVELSHFGVWHTQPPGTDTPGWTPYNYPPAIDLPAGSDIYLHDITLLNPTIGIRAAGQSAGRVTFERIRGQPLTNAVILDNQTDVVRVEDCHWWVYWSLDTPVLNWMKNHCVTYQMGRVDNPVFTGCFAIWHRIGVQCQATSNGFASLATFDQCGWDQCGYFVVVNDAVGNHTLSFTNCYAQGDPTVTLSPGILIAGAGNDSNIRLANCVLRSYSRNIVYISATGVGNRVRIGGDCILSEWDGEAVGNPAFWAEPNNSVWADASTMMSSTHSPTALFGGGGLVAKETAAVRSAIQVFSGTTSASATHKLARVPDAIFLQPRGSIGAAGSYWWTATATTYTVNLNAVSGVTIFFDVLLVLDNSY